MIYDDKSKSLICKVFIKADIVCTPAKARVEMEFWNFGYFRWEGGGLSYEGGYIMLGEVSGSVHSTSIFPFLKSNISKIQKIFVCGTLIFNIHIFKFKIHAGLQVDIDFNSESEFFCSRSSFISHLSGHS